MAVKAAVLLALSVACRVLSAATDTDTKANHVPPSLPTRVLSTSTDTKANHVPPSVPARVLTAAKDTDTRECPEADDILPCLCTADDDSLMIDCSGAQDEVQLEQVFKANFPDTSFYQLTIYHDPTDLTDRLTSIGASTFGEVSFERVIISGSMLEKIDEYSFANSYDTLRYLSLSGNRLRGYPFASLPRYKALRYLDLDANYLTEAYQVISDSLELLSLSGNFITELDPSVFERAPFLRELRLAQTGLAELGAGLFSGLEHLEALDLEGNTLVTLPPSSITLPSHTLAHLTLDSNMMGNIKHDSIIGLSPNATISLKNNEIEELNEEDWVHVFSQLTHPDGRIDLAGNPLVCGCDLAWIMLDPLDRYRIHISDSTTCGEGGPILIFLDKEFFEQFC